VISMQKQLVDSVRHAVATYDDDKLLSFLEGFSLTFVLSRLFRAMPLESRRAAVGFFRVTFPEAFEPGRPCGADGPMHLPGCPEDQSSKGDA
jgi:hypothetical protein